MISFTKKKNCERPAAPNNAERKPDWYRRWKQKQNYNYFILNHVLLCLFLRVCCSCVVNATATNKRSVATSPVSHFSESLTASAAHGTIVAISCSNSTTSNDDNCVVIVSHSPFSENDDDDYLQSEDLPSSATTAVEIHQAEPIVHYGSVTSTLHLLNSDVLLGMTGFVPDVRHLLRCFANMALEFEQVVSSDDQQHQATIPIRKLVIQGISRELRSAALGNNGRPFGVQALIVGRKPTIEIYTVDTIGGWMHWGGGATAIGWQDQAVRIELAKMLAKKNDEKVSIETAVKIAVKSMLQASLSSEKIGEDEDFVSKNNDLPTALGRKFKAVVVFGTPRKTAVRLTPVYIQSICTQAMEELYKNQAYETK